MISAAALARALYSASVEDCATVVYFLADQETKLEPRNTQYPLVERLSNVLPAQSASEYAEKANELLEKARPCVKVPFT